MPASLRSASLPKLCLLLQPVCFPVLWEHHVNWCNYPAPPNCADCFQGAECARRLSARCKRCWQSSTGLWRCCRRSCEFRCLAQVHHAENLKIHRFFESAMCCDVCLAGHSKNESIKMPVLVLTNSWPHCSGFGECTSLYEQNVTIACFRQRRRRGWPVPDAAAAGTVAGAPPAAAAAVVPDGGRRPGAAGTHSTNPPPWNHASQPGPGDISRTGLCRMAARLVFTIQVSGSAPAVLQAKLEAGLQFGRRARRLRHDV